MQILFALSVTVGWLVVLAFFASGEIAVMALDPLRMETEARKGSVSARLLKALRLNPQRFLTTMLIGNNVASMSLAAFFTSQCISLLGDNAYLGIEGATIFAATSMIVLQTLFGELIPKTLAAVATQRMSRLLAWPLSLTQRILTPFSWIVEIATLPLVRLLAGRKIEIESSIVVANLHTALAMAHSSGSLHRTDAAVAQEALTFSRKNLGDVMTPRVDIVALPETATAGAALMLMTESGFSRIPLYASGLDEITGVLMLKDLVRASLRESQGGRDPVDRWTDQLCMPLARRPAFFPETKSIVETLAEMRQMRVHLALVIDEHGGTAGLVSLEDIIEELVGDIRDETDADSSADVISRGAGFAIVTGRARIESLPELSSIEVTDSEAVTVGGLMMEQLGRPAVVGDEISMGEIKVTALKVLGNQIKLMRITHTMPETQKAPPISDQD